MVEIRIESLEGAITALGVAGAGARSTLVVATSQLQTKLSTSNRFTEHLAAVHALIDGEQIFPIFEILTPKDLAIFKMILVLEGFAVNKIW